MIMPRAGHATIFKGAQAPSPAHRDRRYGTRLWKRRRLEVLNRDLWRCRVGRDCPERASVADHILPAFEGMPDGLFFGRDNLRASCKRHNTARGVAARLARESVDGAR